MKLVTISGLDGSGKSTQIELLKTYLEAQGKKIFYFHAIQFSLANRLTGKKTGRFVPSITKASWLKIVMRKIFLMIDIYRFNFLYKNLKKSGCDYILSDRYFYDSVININYLAGSAKRLLAEKKILSPDVTIYLNAEPENIMQRNNAPDQGITYLKNKKELYDNYANIFGMKVIDGNRDKETIFEEIKTLCQL